MMVLITLAQQRKTFGKCQKTFFYIALPGEQLGEQVQSQGYRAAVLNQWITNPSGDKCPFHRGLHSRYPHTRYLPYIL